MQKFMNIMWLIVLLIFLILLVGILFGLNSSMFSGLLGEFVIAPLLILQIIVWIFFGKKHEV